MDTKHDFYFPSLAPYQVNVLELPLMAGLKNTLSDISSTPRLSANAPSFSPINSASALLAGESTSLENLEWKNPCALNLYWFRWVLSHHIIFLCWHKIASHVFAFANPKSVSSHKPLGEICIPLIKLCSLMLLYAATCPNILYKKYIRTFMALYHKGFTAKWSWEYYAYKKAMDEILIHKSLGKWNDPVRTAYYEHKLVHMAVAKKFLGHAPSLLKMEDNSTLAHLTPTTQFIYDSFFLVKRVEHLTFDISAAFFERVTQINMDLYYNPFFSGQSLPSIFKQQKKIHALILDREHILKDACAFF